MSLQLITPPALEPVTLDEAKAHLKVDTTDDDALIERLIAAARARAEWHTGRAFLTQSWILWLDCWPPLDVAEIPLPPASVGRLRHHIQPRRFRQRSRSGAVSGRYGIRTGPAGVPLHRAGQSAQGQRRRDRVRCRLWRHGRRRSRADPRSDPGDRRRTLRPSRRRPGRCFAHRPGAARAVSHLQHLRGSRGDAEFAESLSSASSASPRENSS